MDLMAERKRILGIVQDTADFLSMRYVAGKADAGRARMEGQDMMEDQMKMWSVKIPGKGLSRLTLLQRKKQSSNFNR